MKIYNPVFSHRDNIYSCRRSALMVLFRINMCVLNCRYINDKNVTTWNIGFDEQYPLNNLFLQSFSQVWTYIFLHKKPFLFYLPPVFLNIRSSNQIKYFSCFQLAICQLPTPELVAFLKKYATSERDQTSPVIFLPCAPAFASISHIDLFSLLQFQLYPQSISPKINIEKISLIIKSGSEI